jgi:bifunctional UDP-N-acetylglucosamine pyrophosphorylase / glucosamine-1-phosphate N-acetyltransferase
MTTDHKHNLACIVLAAGNGTRMKSTLPKVMHPVAGKPMIGHVLSALEPLAPARTIVVVAAHMDDVKARVSAMAPNVEFAVQDKQLGTGHAVRCAVDALGTFEGTVLVVYGDTPLIQPDTLASLLETRTSHQSAVSMLAMHPLDPTGYGRLVMQDMPFVERIVECKDANETEKKIGWVWAGMMAFDAAFLKEGLAKLQPSPVTQEYYLTSLIEIARAQNQTVVMAPMEETEAMGVNNRVQLSYAEVIVQDRLRVHFMMQGVTLLSPETTYFQTDTKLGKDVVIQPNVFFGPNVVVGDNVEIRAFSHIEGTHIENNAIIGPFARLRPGSNVGEGAHVGNFVELKKTTLGKGAKANHLSYIGDTMVGEGANIGAGTITCNYDGVHKYNTTIGKDAFIGSNSSLVAPVTIGEGAIIGASSVITQNVANFALALTRPQQINLEGKALQLREKKKKA